MLTQKDTGSPDRTISVEGYPPGGGEPITFAFEVPEETAAAEVGFAYFSIGGAFPFDGKYVFVLTAGETAISLPLLVDSEN